MWGFTWQSSFIRGLHYCGFMGHFLIYYVKKKLKHYKCLTGLGADAQNSGRTVGLHAFEGSLFCFFKQGDAQWLQRRALATADRGRDGDAIQRTQIRGDNKEILADTITPLQRGHKHVAPPPVEKLLPPKWRNLERSERKPAALAMKASKKMASMSKKRKKKL